MTNVYIIGDYNNKTKHTHYIAMQWLLHDRPPDYCTYCTAAPCSEFGYLEQYFKVA